MTSEGLQHPGHEPAEAAPGAGGPAPYGTNGPRSAEQPPPQGAGSPASDSGWPASDGGWPADSGQGGRFTPAGPWAPPQPHAEATRPGSADSGFPPDWSASPSAYPPPPPREPVNLYQPPREMPSFEAQGDDGHHDLPTRQPGQYGPAEPTRPEATGYVPGPPPGLPPNLTPAPLPPQEIRIPGASLAASPPADYEPPQPPLRSGPDGPFPSSGENDFAVHAVPDTAPDWADAGAGAPAVHNERERYDPESFGGFASVNPFEPQPAGYAPAPSDSGPARFSGFEPAQSGFGEPRPVATAAPAAVPQPRVSAENPATGRVSVPRAEPEQAEPEPPAPDGPGQAASRTVSASASVPLASRVMPPTDRHVVPSARPAPQPRVYGRPVVVEPPDERELHGAADQEDPYTPDVTSAPRQPVNGPGEAGSASASGTARVAAAAAPVAPFAEFEGAAGTPYGNPLTAQFQGRAGTPYGSPVGLPEATSAGAVGTARPTDQAPRGAAAVGMAGFAPGLPAPGPQPMAAPPFPSPMGGDAGPGQSGPSPWAPAEGDRDQSRFDAFKPEAEPEAKPEPVPQVRNGRVLAAVLTAAVLLLVIPLSLVWLLTKPGGQPVFNPAVGSCVKQSGSEAVAADCGEAGAFTVESKVQDKSECANQSEWVVVPAGKDKNQVLCLRPVGAAGK